MELGIYMKKYFLVCSLICLTCFTTLFAQQKKLAQAGMKFLNMQLDTRASALGEAFTAVDGSVAAVFNNPAALSRFLGTSEVILSQVKWIADINYIGGAAAINLFDGNYGTLGVSYTYVDYGEILSTIRYENEQGFIDIGVIKPNASVLGLSYAKSLSDKFSVGGTVKYARQSLGASTNSIVGGDINQRSISKNERDVLAFDFGILYLTGFKSLAFGMSVKNFSKEIKYEEEGFQLPLTFKVGLAMNIFDLTDFDKSMHSFLLSVDATHNRDYPEQISLGGEYVFMDLVYLRGGYISAYDERAFSYGIGVKKAIEGFGLGIDYAYIPFGVFDAVQKISIQFSF